MTKWLTADPHFNDPNIIKHAKRPFASVQEMNETLIANWNACVKPNDEIFCIGDFARAAGLKDMPAVSAILSRLNGQKWLILGNHDRKRKAIVNNPHWHKVVDYHELKVNMGREHRQRFILFHNACRTWTNSHRGSYMCHGHSHNNLSDIGGKIMDVGVDCHNFKPISVYEVDAYMYHRPINTNDHHKVANPFTQLPTEELRFIAEQCGKIDFANVVAIDAAWAVRKQIEAALLLHEQAERAALLSPEELRALDVGPSVVVDTIDETITQILRELDEDEVNWSNTVQVGDWVDASDDGFYRSGPQYRTKNKLYQVREVDIRKDADGKVYNRTVIVDSDYLEPELGNKPQPQWLGPSRAIVRDGKVIWESGLQQRIKQLLANRRLSPNTTEAEWLEFAKSAYEPDLSIFTQEDKPCND